MPRFWILFVGLLCSTSLQAQQRLLVELLGRISKDEGITFSYDPDLVLGVELPKEFENYQDLITFLNEESGMKVEEVGESDYLLIPKRTSITISFSDAEAKPLQPFYVDIIRGENEVLYQNFVANPDRPVSFEWTPRPKDTVQIISTAYDPVVIPGNQLITETNQEIALKEKVTYLEEIVIQNYLAKGIALNVQDQTTSLQMSDLALIPGETDGDVLAALATLPGINSPDSRPGNLYIRGSSTDQNLILFNHIPMYHRGHFFGSISPYNAEVVSDVTVSKNGFNPRLGGRVGGAIEIRSQDQLEAYDSYGISVNSLYGNGFVRTKISKSLGISVSARRSFPSSWLSPKLREISTMAYSATVLTTPDDGIDFDQVNVVYEDYNLNVVWEPNKRNKFKISGLFTNNATNYAIANDSIRSLEFINYDNRGLSIEWDKSFSNRINGKFVTFYSDYNSAFETEQDDLLVGDKAFDILSENTLEDAGASYELNLKSGARNAIELGLGTQWSQVSFDYRDIRKDQQPFTANRTDKTFVHSLYGNYKVNGFSRFYFQLGGRLEYYSMTSEPYFSPRLLMNYDVRENLILKVTAGRYFQFLNQMKYLNFGNAGFDNELWRLADGRGIKTLYSDQLMLGGILTKGRFVFDLELFQKQINNVNYASTSRFLPQTIYSTADWDVMGVDFFTKVQVADGFSLWTSYEYTEQTLSFDSLESISYQYKYNQPHRFKMGGLYQKGRWKLSYSWKMLSGLYGRSIDILAELDQIMVLDFSPPARPPMGGGPPPDGMRPPMRQRSPRFREATIEDLPVRYETFHGFDFFATYHVPKTAARKWNAIIGLSLINVFNVENQIDQVVRGATQRNLNERYGLGFAPNLNLTIKW